MKRIVLTLGVWSVTAFGAAAQEIPEWTPQRNKLVGELFAACVKDKGIMFVDLPDGKGKVLQVVDRDRVRATLAARRESPGPDLRDALLAWWPQVNAPTQAGAVVILELLGQETKDEHALGLAAGLSARAAARQGHLDEACKLYKKAVSHFRNAKQLTWQAATLNNLGRLLQDQGSYGEAATFFKEALEVYRALHPPARFPNGHARLASALNSLGSTLHDCGSYREGLDYCKQALAMRHKLYPLAHFPDGHPELAISQNTLSIALQAQGSYAEALDCCKQALAMRFKLYPPSRFPDGHSELATSLNNLAALLHDRGSYAEALVYHRQALAMRRKLYPPARFPNGHPHLAISLSNLGGLLDEQGDYRESLGYHQQALAMRRTLYPPSRFPNGHPELSHSLNNLGGVLQSQGALSEAYTYFTQALAMRRKLYPPSHYPDGHPELAAVFDNLGTVLLSQGAYAEAVDYHKQALEMDRKLYPPSRYPHGHPKLATSLNNLAHTFRIRRAYREALAACSEALQNLRTSRNRIDLDGGPEVAGFFTPLPLTENLLLGRATLLENSLGEKPSRAQLHAAERAFALAAALQDRLRGEVLRNQSDKVRRGEKVEGQVNHPVDLLARLFKREADSQHLEAAFAVIEQDRARVFLESLGQAHAASLAGLPAKLATEERRLSLALRELDARLQRLSLQPGDGAARQVGEVSAARLKAEEEQKAFLGRLRQSHPQYTGFRHPSPCRVDQARSCLRDKEVALLFALGSDFSYALLLEKQFHPTDKGAGIALFRLPGAKEISPAVGTLLAPETLQRPARARELAAELYGKVLGPLQDRLKGKALLIVPDGALALLPFEMLVEGQTDDDGHWLIEKHRIRYAPSVTALHLSRQAVAARKDKPTQLLWALADPIFDDADARLKGPPTGPPKDPTLLAAAEGMARLRGGKFGRLRHSGREVDAICQALGVPVEKAVRGTGASEAAVKAAKKELAQARFVHFATHGVVSERSAYETALVLNLVGNDLKEELGGLNDGFLRLPEVTFLKLNADVVVLSACATARGRRTRGEGISGLARAFLYAGSKGVVCSLWSVDDARAADLMAAFYKHLKDGKGTPDALRQAQRAMLRKGLAPFFWAPFVLMGE